MPDRELAAEIAAGAETALEPGIRIIDAHHHLWVVDAAARTRWASGQDALSRALAAVFDAYPRYLSDDFHADLRRGHDVRATVYVGAGSMYRTQGPEHLRPVGEIEFVSGVAAMAESGVFGGIRMCAGIVGTMDLRLGDLVDEALDAYLAAGGGRLRGVRSPGLHDDDATIAGPGSTGGMFADPRYLEGMTRLSARGLSLDVFILEPQLPELLPLARAFPDTPIVVNHLGSPVTIGRYSEHARERFAAWRRSIRSLASASNVTMKLGGIGLPFARSPAVGNGLASSQELANHWRPYIESCVEAFGVERCMFESNFPVDALAGPYEVVWNAFKRIVAAASDDEKDAVFYRTASRVYRLGL